MTTGMDEKEIKNLLEIDDSKSVGRLNLERKPTFSELSIGEFSTLISNFSKFKESGQKPVRYS
jgi:hypothetical protein